MRLSRTLRRLRRTAGERWCYLKFLFRHFRNPILVLSARLGLVKLPHFLFRIANDGQEYRMLGRLVSYGGGDVFVLREVLIEGIYAPVLDVLPPGPVRVVDIGANIGAFTVWLHRVHGVAEAFCFEPDPESFKLCVCNLGLNGCEHGDVYPTAVGGIARQAEMWSIPNEPAKSGLFSKDNATLDSGNVQVISFADWLLNVSGNFDLLKIDCEGAEWEILDADPTVFTRFATVIAEIHPDPGGQRRLSDFPDILSRNGFETLRWECNGCGFYVGRRKVTSADVRESAQRSTAPGYGLDTAAAKAADR